MNPLVWTLEDALALRCPVELVGAHRTPNGRPEGLLDPLATPSGREGMRAFALAHLCRLAQGDGRPAVEACRELLARCGAPANEAPESADLLDLLEGQRLAYRMHDASVGNALPSVPNGAHLSPTLALDGPAARVGVGLAAGGAGRSSSGTPLSTRPDFSVVQGGNK